MRKLVELLIAAVLLTSAACGGGDDSADDADPTVPTAASSSTAATTAAATDPFAVPEQIDAAYVDRVLVELNRVYGDVVRKIRATNLYERSDLDPLRAIFNDPLLELQANQFATILDNDASLYRQPIGDRRMTVKELITTRKDCVFVEVLADFSAVASKPPPSQPRFITLRPTQSGADPTNVNPTPWSMSGESDVRDDQCAD